MPLSRAPNAPSVRSLSTPALVIFDCDGVLVDSETLSSAVLARELTALGLPTSTAEARRTYQGVTTRDMVLAVQKQLAHPLPTAWREQLEREEVDTYQTQLKATVGVREVLERLRSAGIPRCIASQGTVELSELKLAHTGLREFFAADGIFSGELVPRGKPAPDLFLLAAETYDTPPERCVVIEDSPSGATGAVAAGMPVLGYTADPDTDAAGLARAGAQLFTSMSELPALLGLQP
jgi:HAD superfamily hydrolase (TIGR01509 family)